MNHIPKMERWNLKIAIIFLVLFAFNFDGMTQVDVSDSNIWSGLEYDALRQEKFSLVDLEKIFTKIDFYDNVRTNKQKEEIIKYMLEQCEASNYRLGIAQCRNILGVIYRDQSKYSEAIEMHESAVNLADTDTIISIFALNNLGVVYRRMDKPRLALEFHMKALKLAESMNVKSLVARRSMGIALNSIGNINLTLNQPGKALEVFERSLELEKESKNALGLAINLQNIGGAYEMMGRLDTALYFYNYSLIYNEQINSTVGRAICYNSIGNIYLLKEEPIKALEYFHKAMIFAELSKDNYYISQTYANIGKVYLHVNLPDKAFEPIKKFNEIALKINSGSLIKDSYLLLSKYYEQTNNFKNALDNYRHGMAVNDSIINERNSRYLNELQIFYEAQKKEQQIELLTVENRIKTQQTVIVITVFMFLIIVVFILILFQQKKNGYRQNELEQRLFRSQMNPHFIFNALGSIQSFMYKNEPIKAANYLGLYSSLTRSILKNSNLELITLEDELDTLHHYIEIEKMRLRDNFTFRFEMDKEIEPDFTYVPPIMLQPFIENAIHHGLKSIPDKPGIITLSIKQKEEHIHIELSDNGIGINSTEIIQRVKSHESMGLKIFKERMKLIQKKYKKSVNFAIVDLGELNSNETGTRIIIDFPLIYPND